MPVADIVIASAKRTAVGSFNGAFGYRPAHELGAAAITAALKRREGGCGRRRRSDPGPDPLGRPGAESRRVRPR